MKRILVPTDFSKESLYACKAAASIARKTNSEIVLLHLFDTPGGVIDQYGSGGGSSGAQAISYMKGIHLKFEKLASNSFFDGIKLFEAVRSSSAHEGIIEESQKREIDLIVMGSQGATGIEEMLVGSNTEKVVRHSQIPVLVVKQDFELFDVRAIVFASDFGDESKITFPNVIEYASMFNAKIHLLFVNTVSNFKSTKAIRDRIQNFIDSYNYDDYSVNIYSDKTIEEGILNFAAEHEADVIAINTHNRSGLMQLFSSQIGQDLANHALRPVLTFKIP